MNTGTVEVACPACGTVSHFQELGRDAAAFCRVCDYPLFWARGPVAPGAVGEQGGDGLRRLPGTAGRVQLATIDCPACTEPNPVSATICIRCGSDLRPVPTAPVEPVVAAPAPPPPPPPPPPARRVIWPWILLAVLAVAAVVVLLILTL